MAITFNSGYSNSPKKKANPVERGTIYSGNFASFDGSNDYVEIPDSNPLDISGDWSISCWIKPDTMTGNRRIMGKQASSDQCNYGIGIESGNQFGAFFNDGTWRASYCSTDTLSVGIWYYVAATWTDSTEKMSLYIDGSLVKETTISGAGTPSSNSDPVLLGKNKVGGGEYFHGEISNIQLWDTVLTLAQIQELYKQPELILPTGTTSSNLKGHWLLNEGAGTSAFDSHIPSGEKKFGETSMYFLGNNGSDTPGGTYDYISIPDHNDLDFGANDFTIEFWVNHSSALHNKNLISKASSFVLDHYANANGFYYFSVSGVGSVKSEAGSAESPNWGWSAGWHHVAVTRESTNLRMWVDGVLKDTFNIGTTALATNTNALNIGGAPSSQYSTTGYMDEIRISDIARYTTAFTAPTSAFVSDANTLVLIHADNSRNKSSGQVINSAPINSYLDFDGSLDKGLVDVNTTTYTSITASCWINASWSGAASWDTILFGCSSNASVDDGFGMFVNNTSEIIFYVDEYSKRASYASSATTNNQWHLFTGTYDGTDTKIYLDGVLKDTEAGVTWDTHNPNNDMHVMSMNHGSSYFLDGNMAQCGIWNTALTVTQILAMYNEGRNSTWTDNYNTGLTGYWKMNSLGTVQDLTSNDNDMTITGTDLVEVNHVATAYNNATLTDYRSHGVISGATWDTTDNNEIYQTALVKGRSPIVFDGVNDYVSIADTNNLSFGNSSADSVFSMSAWIEMADATAFRIVGKGVFNTAFEYVFGTDSADKLGLWLGDNSVGTTYIGRKTSSAVTAHEGSLIHACVTYDATEANTGIKVYLNGVAQATESEDAGSYVAMENLGAVITIGEWNTDFADGYIDEVAIWDKVLSQSEVATLYNNGTSYAATNVQSSNIQGYWRNDGTGTWADRKPASSLFKLGHSSAIKLISDPSSYQQTSGSMISAGDSSDWDFGTGDFTIELWVYQLTVATKAQQVFTRSNGVMDFGCSVNTGGSSYYTFTFGAVGATNVSVNSDMSAATYVSGWHHLAIQRSTNDLHMFVDGVLNDTGDVTGLTLEFHSYNNMVFGAGKENGQYNFSYTDNPGYMDEIRVSNVARYTSAGFTVATVPFTPDSNTKLLIHSDNNGGTFTDSSASGHTIATYYTPVHENFLNDGTPAGSPVSMFLPEGSTAGKDIIGFPLAITTADVFKGSNNGQYMKVPYNENLNFGAGDFTVEYWVNVSAANKQYLLTINDSGSGQGQTSFYVDTDAEIVYMVEEGSWQSSTFYISVGEWYHFVLTRAGTVTKFYVNTVLKHTGSCTASALVNNSQGIFLGTRESANDYLEGAIDELRIYHKALSSDEIINNFNYEAVAKGKEKIEV